MPIFTRTFVPWWFTRDFLSKNRSEFFKTSYLSSPWSDSRGTHTMVKHISGSIRKCPRWPFTANQNARILSGEFRTETERTRSATKSGAGSWPSTSAQEKWLERPHTRYYSRHKTRSTWNSKLIFRGSTENILRMTVSKFENDRLCGFFYMEF